MTGAGCWLVHRSRAQPLSDDEEIEEVSAAGWPGCQSRQWQGAPAISYLRLVPWRGSFEGLSL
jgi:hypothetical protein